MNNLAKGAIGALMGVTLALPALAQTAEPSGNWGPVIEQNQVALVLQTLGDRSEETLNVGDNNFSSQIVTAARAPVSRPGVFTMIFPLGLQSYTFSARPGVDSPNDEGLTCDSIGSEIGFDVVVHLYLDRSMDNLRDRLVAFTEAYRLRSYAGEPDVLAALVRDRFSQILRDEFIGWCSNKNALTIMRSKSELNKLVLDAMNDHFNQYALRFTLAGVSSAMRVTEETQAEMDASVVRDAETAAERIRNTRVKPIEKQIENTKQSGLDDAAQIRADARKAAAATIALAESDQRTAIIDVIGVDGYLRLERLSRMVNGLDGSSTTISIVPGESRLIMNTNTGASPVKTVKKPKVVPNSTAAE